MSTIYCLDLTNYHSNVTLSQAVSPTWVSSSSILTLGPGSRLSGMLSGLAGHVLEAGDMWPLVGGGPCQQMERSAANTTGLSQPTLPLPLLSSQNANQFVE